MAEPMDNAGWTALESALEGVYGDARPRHWASAGEWRFGGDVALRGVSAYWNPNGRLPHWHFVTFGLTELFGKMSGEADRSGYGFELTLRVAAPAGSEPPAWGLGLMQNLAGYILQTGHPFAPGHTFNTQGPLTDEPPTSLTGLAFTADPGLPAEVESPNGRFTFLQVVGLTEDERAAAKAWSSDGLLGLLRERDPLLVTDLSRPSLLADPALARRIEEGAAREGSSMGALLVPGLRWSGAPFGADFTVEVPAGSVEDLRRLLAGRLTHGKPLALAAPDGEALEQVRFAPGEAASVAREEERLQIVLTPGLVETLRTSLRPIAGIHRFEGLPGLTLRVR